MNKLAAIGVICAAAAPLAVDALSEQLKIVRYPLRSDKITRSIRIAALADLHGSFYGRHQCKLIAAIKSLDPDVVAFVGDTAETVADCRAGVDILRSISGRYHCCLVMGNHEYYACSSERIRRIFTACGADVLSGSNYIFEKGGRKIAIAGCDDPFGGEYNHRIQMESALSCDADLKILLSHRPDLVGNYSASGADIVICGHAHGGQVILPHIMNGLFAPNQGIFPPFAGGLYHLENCEMIVSRGLCKNIIPRIYNRPELVAVDILPQK